MGNTSSETISRAPKPPYDRVTTPAMKSVPRRLDRQIAGGAAAATWTTAYASAPAPAQQRNSTASAPRAFPRERQRTVGQRASHACGPWPGTRGAAAYAANNVRHRGRQPPSNHNPDRTIDSSRPARHSGTDQMALATKREPVPTTQARIQTARPSSTTESPIPHEDFPAAASLTLRAFSAESLRRRTTLTPIDCA